MPARNDAAFEFLATRRSRPAKAMIGPAPSRDELVELLNVASRVPDHGALVPWRFVVLEKPACEGMADLIAERGVALDKAPEDIEKARGVYAKTPLVVAVVHALKDSPKIPDSEQILTGGAVCLSLVNAALAKGWGANWISGWLSYDRGIMDHLGLAAEETLAGLVHIGTEALIPPERPRPDVNDLITWMDG